MEPFTLSFLCPHCKEGEIYLRITPELDRRRDWIVGEVFDLNNGQILDWDSLNKHDQDLILRELSDREDDLTAEALSLTERCDICQNISCEHI